MIARRLLSLTLPLVLLTGCISLTPTEPDTVWRGRFSLIVEETQQKTHESGRFDYSLISKDSQILDLKSPIGTTVARIQTTSEGATLQVVGRDKVAADSIETLMQETLGFSVPITGLAYWLEGTPDPRSAYNEDSPDAFSQMGWHITVAARDNQNRVKRLVVHRESQPSIRMTLLIQERKP